MSSNQQFPFPFPMFGNQQQGNSNNGGFSVNFMVVQSSDDGPLPFRNFDPFSMFNSLGGGMPNLANLFGEMGQDTGSYQTPFGNFNSYQDLLDHLARNHQARGPPPTSKGVLERLPTVTIDEQDVKDNAECSICKDNFSLEDKALKLPCNHLYHNDCIQPWLQQHNTCPVCRYELPVDDPDYEKSRKQRMATRHVAEDELLKTPLVSNEDIDKFTTELLQIEQKCESEHIHKSPCTLLKPISFDSLSCGHIFHSECLESKLRVTGELPVTKNLSDDPNLMFKCPSCNRESSILKDLELD